MTPSIKPPITTGTPSTLQTGWTQPATYVGTIFYKGTTA